MRRGRPRKETEHYVDNAKLHENLKNWLAAKKKAIAEGKTPPRIPDSIGKDIMSIAQRFATQKNYSQYPFVDEMIFDAIENCIRYIDNYNPEKYSNPFAYFTQFTYYAFIRRIAKERKVLYVKYKMMDNASMGSIGYDSEYYDPNDHAGIGSFELNNTDIKNDFIESFETSLEKKKLKKKVIPDE